MACNPGGQEQGMNLYSRRHVSAANSPVRQRLRYGAASRGSDVGADAGAAGPRRAAGKWRVFRSTHPVGSRPSRCLEVAHCGGFPVRVRAAEQFFLRVDRRGRRVATGPTEDFAAPSAKSAKKVATAAICAAGLTRSGSPNLPRRSRCRRRHEPRCSEGHALPARTAPPGRNNLRRRVREERARAEKCLRDLVRG